MNKLKINIGLNLRLTHCNVNAKILNFRPSNAAPLQSAARGGALPRLPFPPPLRSSEFVMIPVTKTFGQSVV